MIKEKFSDVIQLYNLPTGNNETSFITTSLFSYQMMLHKCYVNDYVVNSTNFKATYRSNLRISMFYTGCDINNSQFLHIQISTWEYLKIPEDMDAYDPQFTWKKKKNKYEITWSKKKTLNDMSHMNSIIYKL